MNTNQHKSQITHIAQLTTPINWTMVSFYENLSENFIREHYDKVDWDALLEGHRFTEEFLTEFKNRFDWLDISCTQVLSETLQTLVFLLN